jgi:hypothetical protein
MIREKLTVEGWVAALLTAASHASTAGSLAMFGVAVKTLPLATSEGLNQTLKALAPTLQVTKKTG